MDGMEVVGSQPHAATSPFLLSSPPLGHHHHHAHATFNLQTVQLSFDACLPYNAASSSSGSSVTCSIGGTPVSATCTNSSSTSCKTVPALSLSSCVPLHAQLQITPTDSGAEHNHGRHHHHHHHHPHRLDEHQQHQHHLVHADPTSPSVDAADGKRNRQADDDDKGCIRNCSRNDLHDANDKDKPGDLNTPVTTSSDLPSFFGPSALVEPPPISGTYRLAQLTLLRPTRISRGRPAIARTTDFATRHVQ